MAFLPGSCFSSLAQASLEEGDFFRAGDSAGKQTTTFDQRLCPTA